MKSKSLKSLIFDAGLFTYTFALIAALFFPLGEERATAAMAELALAAAATFALSLLLTVALERFGVVSVGAALFHRHPGSGFRSFRGAHLLIIFTLSLAVSLEVTEFSFRELTDPEGLAGAFRLYNGLVHANLHLLPTAIVQVIETVFLAFLATVLALPAAFLLAFLGAKNIMRAPALLPIYFLTRALQNLVRSVEPLIWALIFTVWVGIGPFAGMLALLVHSVAGLAKQYSEIIEDISPGPVEGIRSTGAGDLQVILFGVVPQVLMPFISFTIYRWDTNVRMATVIGLIGGGGIGTMLIKYQGQAMWPEVGCIIFVIAAAVWLMDTASAYIREALR